SIHKALKTNEEVVREGVDVATNGETQRINLIVRPIPETGPEGALYLVVFQEVGAPRGKDASLGGGGDQAESGEVVKKLESELRMKKEHLQGNVEEVEASNEELKSSNEELLSTNEELQSANEELQTSKEEMQSINEELHTVTGELHGKIEALDRSNSDLHNLFASTYVGTVFLDNALCIK